MGYWRFNYHNNRLERLPDEDWPDWMRADLPKSALDAVCPGKEHVELNDADRMREWSEENKL